jgi:hypothetical protein
LPVDVLVAEMSAGGVLEEVKDWSETGKRNVHAAVQLHAANNNKFEVMALPDMTAAEKSSLEEHVALLDVVHQGAINSTRGGTPWQHKINHFDYTLGDGLKFLKEKTGADAALVVTGLDVVSSAERQAAFIVAAAFGVGLQTGFAILRTAVVDLETGDLLWIDYTFSQSKTFREQKDVNVMVEDMLKNFPGIKEYKATVAKNQ